MAILDKNSPSYLELYFGIPRAGAVAVPLNYRLAPPELAYILDDSEATTLFFSIDYAPQVEALRPQLPSVRNYVCLESKLPWALDYETLLASANAAAPPAPRSQNDVFLQMYTSGTTGRPKGAMLTHDNLVANTLTALAERDYSAR